MQLHRFRAALISISLSVAASSSLAALAIACSSSDPDGGQTAATSGSEARSPEPAGQSCSAAAQCYADLDGGVRGGDITCLTKVPNGYCTHVCTQDTECCAVPGECRTQVEQVCSPFTNQGAKYCFLSCEDDDIARAVAANADAGFYDGGLVDGGSTSDAYCQSFAGTSTRCRSSGGGSENRKVCIPQE